MPHDPKVTATTPRRIPSSDPPPEAPTAKVPQAPPEPELGWSQITLPSRGRFYGEALPGGVIQLRPLMAEETAMLATQGGSPLDKMVAVLRACGRFGQLDIDDMLATDQLMAAIALRSVSFGNEYSFDYYCERCQAKQRATVDVARDCNERAVAPDLEEPFKVSLPDCGKTVECRFLRVRDLKLVLSNARRVRQQGVKSQTKLQTVDTEEATSYLYRIALTLVAVDGQPFKNVLEKDGWLRKLTARDLLTIERAITTLEPGVDTDVFLACSKCGAENEMTIPFSAEFLRPTNL
jgi:hypothetical protein